MRNAFVVLVSLYIGLVSGFIVPSSAPEFSNLKNSSITKKSGDEQDEKLITSAPKSVILIKAKKDIYEKDLYEHATEKQNNQSERAFIYINQKYKKPVRNKIIKILPIDKAATGRSYVTPTVGLMGVPQTPCPSAFDSGTSVNSYFQGFEFSDKQSQEMASYYAAPNIFRCNFKDESVKKRKEVNHKSQVQVQSQANRVDERRDYFELLKPPILRPVNRVNNKPNYDTVHHNQFPPHSPTNLPKDNFLNKYNIKNQFISKPKIANERQDHVRKNYGFESPYMRRPVFRTKEFINRGKDGNFDGDFINQDDASHRIYENNPEDDKLLDKYLKDTLEEQAPNNNKLNANIPDCSYRECILQTNRLYTNNGLLIRPDCKCGRRLNIKHVDPFIAKDRSLREETKRNDTVPKSTEINYYEELLTDDSNIAKLDDDVIRPPNKINETTVH